MAYLNGHQDHFTLVGDQESARSTLHLAELFRLADAAGLLRDPEQAISRMRAVLATRGIEADAGPGWRSPPPVAQYRDSAQAGIAHRDLRSMRTARHPRAIDPWRDQVAAVGLNRAVKAVRDAGLELSGYCRGGMFTADAAHRQVARDDNRRAVDEAKALDAPCVVLVCGGLPQYSRPGSAPSKDIWAAQAQARRRPRRNV